MGFLARAGPGRGGAGELLIGSRGAWVQEFGLTFGGARLTLGRWELRVSMKLHLRSTPRATPGPLCQRTFIPTPTIIIVIVPLYRCGN